jgi:4-amino-4-deoxy-L-arabinose transferase-like glycosyltransferase
MHEQRETDPTRDPNVMAATMSGWRQWDWLLIIIVSAAVCFTALGRYGFRSTEGHRVIPAWTMLDTGDWLTPRMFEMPYLRKPPGLQWAIATFSAALGRTEFAARAVSATAATLMAMLAWWFAWRWFGRRWGLIAGMTQALCPQFWSSARSAEIEALNNLGTLASVLMIVHIMVARRDAGQRASQIVHAIALATALCVTALAKGPASGPVIAAAIVAGCLATRAWNVLQWRALIGGIFLAATALTLVAIAMVNRISETGESVVLETDAAGFLWDIRELHRIFTLAPIALIYALPASLALIPMWKWWRRGSPPPALMGGRLSATTQCLIAQTLALACVLSLAMYTLLGIHNLRYALPATTMLAPLAAYVIARMRAAPKDRPRSVLARHALAFAAIALMGGAACFIMFYEPKRGVTSGREPARLLATYLSDGAIIWAEDMIEARPELLLYAQMSATQDLRTLRPLWKKAALQRRQLPSPGTLLLLSDEEYAAYLERHPNEVRDIASGRVHEFDYVLVEVGPNVQ